MTHWEVDDAAYSITYRLDDALPPHESAAYEEERRAILKQLELEGATAFDRSVAMEALMIRYDTALDRGYGSCALRNERIASLVQENLKFHDGPRYRLLSWNVMPNHLHTVIHLYKGSDLANVLHSWKSYTASRANEALNTIGRFWQREYFDRLIRDRFDLERTLNYVFNNSEKGGIRDWQWRGKNVEGYELPY